MTAMREKFQFWPFFAADRSIWMEGSGAGA
jgi:hypothetical protein